MWTRKNLGLVTIYLLTTCTTPGGAGILSSISPALERAATYGYYILGYAPSYYYQQPEHHHYEEEIDIPHVKKTFWSGHIPVQDFISPILQQVGKGSGGYGHDPQRIVKGYENRLGLRVAVPYLGDFQVTREVGPGRFLDKLGPGKYVYPGLKDGGYKGFGTASYDNYVEDNHVKETVIPDNTAMYQSMKNYPWYRK
ncbi:hypothetical protein OTU49_004241 [Cherax quadricarinatus]|uniref:Uncharacterized protein n=1 Tax=Cherax quadricarinatus TaxID=27406 RepID=A0AAW0XID2_CHEQU|nr:uncharacterized protein LOC128695887 isoform X2 [Cherax quadricarinatus]